MGRYNFSTSSIFHASHFASTAIQIANNITHVFIWNHDFNTHNGLQNYWISVLYCLLKSHGRRNLESEFRRINIVIRSIVENSFHVDYRMSYENTMLHCLGDTRLHGRYIFSGNRSANNGIFKYIARASFQRLEPHLNVTILTSTTALSHKSSFGFCDMLNRFPVCHLRAGYVGSNLKFPC